MPPTPDDAASKALGASHLPSRLRALLREGVSIATAGAVILLARSSLADHYRVPTGSMIPTVEVGDHVMVNKLAYGLRVPLTHRYALSFARPKRGDVVVLDSPEHDVVLLKRVIAKPGDWVEIREGHVWINGQAARLEPGPEGLLEALEDAGHRIRLEGGGGPDFGPVRVPDGRFLVMGDNRGHSHDGRMFGLVEGGSILGRAEGLYRSGEGLHRL